MRAASEPGRYRVALSSAIGLAAATPSFLVNPTHHWMVASCWVLLELLIGFSISYLLGIVVAMATATGWDTWLDRSISRGLELVAALPLVLTAAVVVVLAATPIAVAVALVIGTLDGLRSARVILGVIERQRTRKPPVQRVSGQRRELARRVSIAFLPTLFEQLIGLEAALTWLGLCDEPRTGGWGAYLGQSAKRGDLSQIAVWSLATIGISVGLRLLTGPRPGRQHDELPSSSRSVPPGI